MEDTSSYPTRYRDRSGKGLTSIINDGRFLSVILRGVKFRGSDFDGLASFRGNTPGYRTVVRTKDDLLGIWGTMTEFVREMFLCPESQERAIGTGYRG